MKLPHHATMSSNARTSAIAMAMAELLDLMEIASARDARSSQGTGATNGVGDLTQVPSQNDNLARPLGSSHMQSASLRRPAFAVAVAVLNYF